MNRQQNLDDQAFARKRTKSQLEKRRDRLVRYHSKIEKKLENIFAARLTLGLIFLVLLVPIAMNQWTQILLGLEAILGSLFIAGVIYSEKIKNHRVQVERLQNLYGRILLRVQFLLPPTHLWPQNEHCTGNFLSQDLDLVGAESLLNLLDESIHIEGQAQLIEDMINAHYSSSQLLQRQAQVQKLSRVSGLIRRYVRTASPELAEGTHDLKDFVKRSLTFDKFTQTHRNLWVLCAVFWLALGVQSIFDIKTHWGLIWLVYFLYSVASLRKIEEAFTHLQNIILQFRLLIPTFLVIEKLAPVLDLTEFKNRPSQKLKRMESAFSFVSVQSHPIFLFLINGLIPWNYYFVGRSERIRLDIAEHIEPMSREFRWFDSMASLSLVHKYLTQNFPSFTEHFEIHGALHPLIAESKSVPNAFNWPSPKKLMLITGSNMAGKSTFLRAIGINLVLARMGAPVFADRLTTPVMPLKTCIRVSDNVREGFSYFYAETKRIAELLAFAHGERCFYLIDEIFKGTNNRERFIGGKTLIEELSKTDSLGFITTHDLELSKLEVLTMANYHFKDEVRDGKMHFAYKIQPGPCPTTNAIKIMQMAGIPVKDF